MISRTASSACDRVVGQLCIDQAENVEKKYGRKREREREKNCSTYRSRIRRVARVRGQFSGRRLLTHSRLVHALAPLSASSSPRVDRKMAMAFSRVLRRPNIYCLKIITAWKSSGVGIIIPFQACVWRSSDSEKRRETATTAPTWFC